MKNGCSSSFFWIFLFVMIVAFAIDQISNSVNKQILISILVVGGLIILLIFCIAIFQKNSTDLSQTNDSIQTKKYESQKDHPKTPSTKTDSDRTIDQAYVNYCYRTSKRIVDYVDKVMMDDELFQAIKNINGIEVLDTDMFKYCNSRVAIILLHDLWKCYVGSGNKISKTSDYGNLCYSLAVYRLMYGEEFSRNLIMRPEGRQPLQDIGCSTMEFVDSLEVQGFEGPTSFLMEFMIHHLGRDSGQYRNFLYEITECMNSYSRISAKARDYLDDLKLKPQVKSQERSQETPLENRQQNPQEKREENRISDEMPSEAKPKGIERLDDLVGLQSVKAAIHKLSSFVQVQQWRAKEGLRSPVVSYHCVFTGNPGTGKTTVARIIAEIYKELGLLKKGHLVETDRSGLVGEYVGQTAVKTNKIIDSAIDGVLFIDEAYSLITDEYGLEAIATLLKRMEDERDRLVVIIAGYQDEMRKLIDSNPGLASRFNRYFHFEDYSSQELWLILKKMFDQHDYTLDDDATEKIREMLDRAVANGDKGFGNARFVRNLFERILENQAMRLAYEGNRDRNELQRLTIADLNSFLVRIPDEVRSVFPVISVHSVDGLLAQS